MFSPILPSRCLRDASRFINPAAPACGLVDVGGSCAHNVDIAWCQ